MGSWATVLNHRSYPSDQAIRKHNVISKISEKQAGLTFSSISVGASHTLAVQSKNIAFGWGDNSCG